MSITPIIGSPLPSAGLEPGLRPWTRARTLGSGDGPSDPGSDPQIRGRSLGPGIGPLDPGTGPTHLQSNTSENISKTSAQYWQNVHRKLNIFSE